MICNHPYPAPYYMWDAVDVQTQKVSKVPPFGGIEIIIKWLICRTLFVYDLDKPRVLSYTAINWCQWSYSTVRVSTVNRTYELSGITHVTPFRKYGKHSTGPTTYGPESIPTSSCSPVSPFLRFVVSQPSRMKSVHTDCTYGHSNTIYVWRKIEPSLNMLFRDGSRPVRFLHTRMFIMNSLDS